MLEPTTVVALKGLEKAGFITRKKTAEDRRKTFIHLTPHAKELELILAPLNAEVHKVATRGMTNEEVETLRVLMRRVIANLADETAKLPTLSDIKARSEEHTSELQSLMRISYAVFCLKKKKIKHKEPQNHDTQTQKNEQPT